VCGGREEKRKARGYMGGGEKKGNKKEKRNGEWGLCVCGKKKGCDEIRCSAVLAVMSIVLVKLTPLLLRVCAFQSSPIILLAYRYTTCDSLSLLCF
jgi:hypothetical protein